MVPRKIEVFFGVARRPNERMSATQDAMLWARGRASAGVVCGPYGLDEIIASIKRYVGAGGESVWVTELKRDATGRVFECSTTPWGCPQLRPETEERRMWINRRIAELD